jgi:hypothetical protein
MGLYEPRSRNKRVNALSFCCGGVMEPHWWGIGPALGCEKGGEGVEGDGGEGGRGI